MEEDFYIGQKFYEKYPPKAAFWCNSNNAMIIKVMDGDEFLYYEIVEIPTHEMTYEEVDDARKSYRQEHIDTKTIARARKMANGSWTDEDEQGYLALDAEVTAWIEENLPYPEKGA